MAESGQYRSNLMRIMIIATLGGLLFGYDTGVVNGALPFMAAPDQLNLDPLQEGMVVSALLVGAAVGSFCGGKLADYQGRKTNILWLAVIFFVSTLGCSLAPSFHVMLVSRFVLGLAVGGASVTVPAYLAEISPAERRGRMVTQNELISYGTISRFPHQCNYRGRYGRRKPRLEIHALSRRTSGGVVILRHSRLSGKPALARLQRAFC